VHLELLVTQESLMKSSKCLAVPCIFNSILPSCFVDKVDIFTPKLVLRVFVVCLDTEEAHGDFRGEDGLNPVHQKERCFCGGLTG
jgi:hypothetical protein